MPPIALGLTGLVYQIHVFLKQGKVDFASLDWLDWTLFFVVPMLGNASLIAGIYGAWDLTLWLRREPGQDPAMRMPAANLL
jgi:hypothetical protein